jgi:hypothetical protein
MKNDKQAIVSLLSKATNIQGYNINLNEPLDIDYFNPNPEEDEMVIAGKNCTIFYEDLEDCMVKNNTLYFKRYYIIHLK